MAEKKITTNTSASDPVMQVHTHASLSAEDLEAEIASAASAIGGGKTVGGTHIPKHKVEKAKKSTKKSVKKSKPKVASKPKTTTESKTKKESPTVVKKTVVKVRGKSDSTDQVEDKPTIELKKSSTIIESPPVAITPAADVPSVTPHHEKVIRPISSATKIERTPVVEAPKAPEVIPVSEPEPIEALVPKKELPEVTPRETVAPKAPVKQQVTVKTILSKPLPKKGANSIGSRVVGMDIAPATRAPQPVSRVEQPKIPTEESIERSEPETQQPAVESTVARNARHGHKTPHAARIYDTSTYHMPLEVNHHHRKVSTPRWVQFVVLAIGLVSLVVLAYFKGYIG